MPAEKRPLVLALSADYERRTGGWTYAANLCHGLRERGRPVRDLVLPAGFPDPDDATRAAAAAAFAALPDGTTALVDQLCLGVLPEVAACQAGRLRLVMIVHHPLALELGRPRTERARLGALERASLERVALALTTSRTTAAVLETDYGVPPARLAVAPPGIRRRPPAQGSQNGVPNLLGVGAIVPRKDHATLVEALAGLADLPWRLTLVGNRGRASAYVAGLEARIAEFGLADRIVFTGELDEDELAQLWAAADLYVSTSTFEGYGSAIAEAVAAGLPVVTTAAGAVAEWLDPRAGILIPIGDIAGLRVAIGRVLDEPGLRRSLRAGAQAASEALPTWDTCVAAVEEALAALDGAGACRAPRDPTTPQEG